MPKMGLVLQGGGALGAYEYGAVSRLVELGWHPVAVTGVSIGAPTAAAVAGARGGDIGKSLKRLWGAITLDSVPFLPPERQATLSLFGNPRIWRMRGDLFGSRPWTSFYDVSPLRQTLAEVCDFDQLNDPAPMRVAVTTTNVQTGDVVRELRCQPGFGSLRGDDTATSRKGVTGIPSPSPDISCAGRSHDRTRQIWQRLIDLRGQVYRARS
jgi:predicted acylesterase/phospholipase RssA